MKYLKGTVQAISQKFVSRTCHPCNRGSNKRSPYKTYRHLTYHNKNYHHKTYLFSKLISDKTYQTTKLIKLQKLSNKSANFKRKFSKLSVSQPLSWQTWLWRRIAWEFQDTKIRVNLDTSEGHRTERIKLF